MCFNKLSWLLNSLMPAPAVLVLRTSAKLSAKCCDSSWEGHTEVTKTGQTNALSRSAERKPQSYVETLYEGDWPKVMAKEGIWTWIFQDFNLGLCAWYAGMLVLSCSPKTVPKETYLEAPAAWMTIRWGQRKGRKFPFLLYSLWTSSGPH